MMKFSLLQKMTLTAMMLVMSIIATRFLGVYVTPYVRLSPGVSITMFSSILLGPISGAIIGGLGDIFGILISNTSGVAINPFITVTFTLMGATPGLLMILLKKINKEKINAIIFDVFLLIIYIGVLIFTFISPSITMFRRTFTLNLLAKILIPIISLIILIAIKIFVALFNIHFYKFKSVDNRIPSIYQIAFIVIFVQVIFTLFINSFAKWIFFDKILGQTVPFELIFFPALLLSFIYIPINTIIVSYLCVLASKTIRIR